MDDTESFYMSVAHYQRLINSGMAWRLEGSIGRTAMDLIKAGYCLLPSVFTDPAHALRDRELSEETVKASKNGELKKPIFDAYGSLVPYRELLKDGTHGTLSYAREQKPEFWESRAPCWEDQYTAEELAAHAASL